MRLYSPFVSECPHNACATDQVPNPEGLTGNPWILAWEHAFAQQCLQNWGRKSDHTQLHNTNKGFSTWDGDGGGGRGGGVQGVVLPSHGACTLPHTMQVGVAVGMMEGRGGGSRGVGMWVPAATLAHTRAPA